MNWGIKVLQTSALPLGYGAKCDPACFAAISHDRVINDEKPHKIHLPRYTLCGNYLLERDTRFELATFTLAR